MISTLRSLASLLVPSFVSRRYAAKFVVAIAFVVAAIALVGFVGYAQVTDTVTQDTRDDLQTQATMQADSISEWSGRMVAQTRSLAGLQVVNEGDSAAVRNEIDIARSADFIRGTAAVHVVDLDDDTVVASSGRESYASGTPLSTIEDPWARTDLGSAVAVNQVWTSDSSYNSTAAPERRVVAFAVETTNGDRAVVVEASARVRVNQLYQQSARQNTVIVNRSGGVVLESEQQPFHVLDRAEHENVTRDALGIGSSDSGSTQFRTTSDHLRAYAPVDGTGNGQHWVAVTSVPKSEAYAVRQDVGRNVIAIVGLAILALSIVGIVLGAQTVLPLKRLRSKAKAMEEGDLDVDLESRRTDEIGQLYGTFASMRDALRERITQARDARDEAQAERERVRQINDELERTAAEYSAVMEQAAGGDLTARMPTDVENHAMAAVALDFNEMLEELEQTVGELNAFAAEVATASEQVTASSEEVRSASEQISESVQEISVGAERQTDSLQTVNGEMEALSTTTEEIAASSNQVADLAERTAATGQSGREAAQAAIEEIHSVEGASEQAVEEMSRLAREVEQIDELIDRISEIADQTNMLALNANIEASRSAGGSGEAGFGVVAQEVKELSDDAKEAAGEVEQRLESIREQTRRSAEEVDRTSDDVEAASRQVEEAVDALEEIADYASETHSGVQEISAATEQQAASTQEVVSMVDEATTISEETTAESENVAAAAEEQTTALTEVSRSASDLSEQAARLSEALDRFETDAKLESGPAVRMLEGAGPGDPGAADAQSGSEAARSGSGSVDSGPATDRDDADAFAPDFEADDFGTDRSASRGSTTGESVREDSTGEPTGDGLAAESADGKSTRESTRESTDGNSTRESTDQPTDDEPRPVADEERPTDGGTDLPRYGSVRSTSDPDSGPVPARDESRGDDPVDDIADDATIDGWAGDDATIDGWGDADSADASVGANGFGVAGDEDDSDTGGNADDFDTADDRDGPDTVADRDAADDAAHLDAADGNDPVDAPAGESELPPEAGSDAGERVLTDVHGVGETRADALRAAGFETVDDLRAADVEELAAVEGFGDALAEQVSEDVEE